MAQSPVLSIVLPESVATNASGGINHSYDKFIAFTVFNPFGKSEFDVGHYSTPTLVDVDRDGDVDIVSGEQNGGFWFYSNKGNGIYTVYDTNNSASPFSGASFDVGRYSTPTLVDIDDDGDLDMFLDRNLESFGFIVTRVMVLYTVYDTNNSANPFSGASFNVGLYSDPTFVDLDGDEDLDMVSGEHDGGFVFYSNTGNNSYTVYDKNNNANPFSGASFDVGKYSDPAFVDLDGDGDLDMISGEDGGGFWVL